MKCKSILSRKGQRQQRQLNSILVVQDLGPYLKRCCSLHTTYIGMTEGELQFQYCEAQGKGRAQGRPRKVTQRSFKDCRWWMVDILSLMLYIKFGCHHHIAASSTTSLKIRLLNS